MASASTKRFIILGFPRSGTTLLARILDAHDEISCPPETHLFSGVARLLKEQTDVEGPPIGPLTGLAFAGLDEKELTDPLRDLLFSLHDRIAGERTVCVEKTGTDIFHLETLVPFLDGHAKFICLTRNPLDVIPSNIDLADAMGARLPELFEMTRCFNSPHEGLAHAWVNRTEALDRLSMERPEDVLQLRYEDLTEDPETTLNRLLGFMGLKSDVGQLVETAFSSSAKIGLGDFRIDGTKELRKPDVNAWRKRIPRAAAARIIPILTPLMEQHGYKVPKTPKAPDRDLAVKQFTMAAQMRRNTAEKA